MGILDRPNRRTVAIGVLGQSNEHGSVSLTEKTTFPQAFRSLRRGSVAVPLAPAAAPGGGWLCKAHDDLYDAGWLPIILNGAVGSMSLIRDGAGIMDAWAPNTIYYRQRRPGSLLDRGHAGAIVAAGGGVWRCVAGNDKVALSGGVGALTGGPGRGDGYIENVVGHPGVSAPGTLLSITVTGAPTGGTYTLTGNGRTTDPLTHNASYTTVQTAIRALGGPLANAVVTTAGPGIFGVTLFPGTADPAPLALGTNALSGGTAPGVAVTATPSANFRSGAANPFPADVTGYTRGTLVLETPGAVSDAGTAWRFEGFQSGVPPQSSGSVGAWPSVGQIFNQAHAGMGWDPFGIVQRLHEEMQRVDADRKIVYIANGQGDLGFASTTAGTVCTPYRDALISIGQFFLTRGYEVMIGFTNYSPGSAGTAAQWGNLVLSVNAAITSLQAGTDGDRVHAGANLYALMGTTGPMASGGGFLAADNVHLNARGSVGPALSGVQPAGKHIADAIKAAL